MRNWMTPIMYTLIAFALFYVGYMLVKEPADFLGSIVMMIGIAVLIFGAFYFLFMRNRGFSGGNRNEMKKYKQAVKQSKQKYKQTTPVVKKSPLAKLASKTSSPAKKPRRRGGAPHLRVIEGNKDKDKNRASF